MSLSLGDAWSGRLQVTLRPQYLLHCNGSRQQHDIYLAMTAGVLRPLLLLPVLRLQEKGM